MTQLSRAADNDRQILFGLGQLEEPLLWSRRLVHDQSKADPPSRFPQPISRVLSGSTPNGSRAVYPVPRNGRPDVLRNGHFRLGVFGAEELSGVAQADERAGGIPDAGFLIIDDCKLNRENLAAIFAAHGGSRQGTAWDVPSLRIALSAIVPKIVIFNVRTRDNVTLLRMVRTTCPEAKVIVVGIGEDEEAEIIACAEAGVAGYHLRADSFDDLLALISGVANGESLCSPKVSAILLKRLSAIATKREPETTELVLTPRETQILGLVESGLSNQEIADHLYIALHTVKNHVHSVLNKLGVSTRAAAAAYSRSIRDPEAVNQI